MGEICNEPQALSESVQVGLNPKGLAMEYEPSPSLARLPKKNDREAELDSG